LKHYLRQAATAAGFAAYVAQYIDAPGGNPEQYMDTVHDQAWE
jgi:hypothetical protein